MVLRDLHHCLEVEDLALHIVPDDAVVEVGRGNNLRLRFRFALHLGNNHVGHVLWLPLWVHPRCNGDRLGVWGILLGLVAGLLVVDEVKGVTGLFVDLVGLGLGPQLLYNNVFLFLALLPTYFIMAFGTHLLARFLSLLLVGGRQIHGPLVQYVLDQQVEVLRLRVFVGDGAQARVVEPDKLLVAQILGLGSQK